MSVFYGMVVTRSPSPMTHFTKIFVFQCHYTPLLLVANLVGVGTVVIPVLSECSTILASMSLWLPGKLFKTGQQRVASVFLVEH